MTMIRLTVLDNRRSVSPIDVNTDHIVSVVRRKTFRPAQEQQDPTLTFCYSGAIVSLVTGDRLNVIEDAEDIWKLSGIEVVSAKKEVS